MPRCSEIACRATPDAMESGSGLSCVTMASRFVVDSMTSESCRAFEFAGFEGAECGVGDDLGRVDDDVCAEFAEFLARHGVARAGDDVLLVVPRPDVLHRLLVRLDVGCEDEDHVPVGDEFRGTGVDDVRVLGVQVLVAERLHPGFVLVEDENVLAPFDQLLGDRVPDASAPENRVCRHRGDGGPTTHVRPDTTALHLILPTHVERRETADSGRSRAFVRTARTEPILPPTGKQLMHGPVAQSGRATDS